MSKLIDIVQAALEEIGAYQPGETVTAADADRAHKVANNMIASWSNENLACFAFLTQSTPLRNNVTQYTCGPGGDVSVRPLKIQQAYITDTEGNKYQIEIVEEYDFNLIINGAPTVTSQVPTVLFYDPQFPLGIINVYPSPLPPLYTLWWTSYLQLNGWPSLLTDIELPPGYEEAIQHNLALRMTSFMGLKPDPLVVEYASETKGIIKRQNIRLDVSYYDPEIISRSSGAYDVRSDTFGPRGTGSS